MLVYHTTFQKKMQHIKIKLLKFPFFINVIAIVLARGALYICYPYGNRTLQTPQTVLSVRLCDTVEATSAQSTLFRRAAQTLRVRLFYVRPCSKFTIDLQKISKSITI